MSSASALFFPIRVGNMNLQRRIVLSPLSRYRAYTDHVLGPHAEAYYSQRASVPGTFLLTESTMISQNAGGLDYVPGTYTDAQVDAWKKVCCIGLTECELTEVP